MLHKETSAAKGIIQYIIKVRTGDVEKHFQIENEKFREMHVLNHK
jgi:hypothetical protein